MYQEGGVVLESYLDVLGGWCSIRELFGLPGGWCSIRELFGCTRRVV